MNPKQRDRVRLIRKLADQSGWRCGYCGQRIFPLAVLKGGGRDGVTLDHITAKSKGGDEGEDNFVLACGNCNRAKFDQDVIEYLKWLAYIRSSRFICLILKKLSKKDIERLTDQEWDALRKEFFK